MQPSEFISSIKAKKTKIGVIGLGYVGLPLAMLFAKKGFKVTGFIRDHKKISAINGGTWVGDSVDPKALRDVVKKKALRAEHIDSKILDGQDVYFICVPTPVYENKKPDLTAIREVAKRLSVIALSGKIIVNESTVAPQTTRDEFGHFPSVYYLACSPERVDPGNKGKTVETVAKVVGGKDQDSLRIAKGLYEAILAAPTVTVSSMEAAETAKMLENTYRAVNIALVNEFAWLAEKTHLDIVEVINAAKTKWSFHAHYPSIGVGGHCIPVDPWYLVEFGKENGVELPLISLGLKENEHMTRHVAEKLRSLYRKGARVLLYGITYKKNVKDMRESPVLRFAEMLKAWYIPFSVYDPLFSVNEIEGFHLSPGRLTQADIFIVGTDHDSLEADYKKAIGPKTIVLDGRNFFDKKVGKVVYGVGRTLL